MKQSLLTMILMCAVLLAHAQTSGTVTYSETLKMEIRMTGEDEELAKLLPKEQKLEKLLSFSQEASLYVNKASEKEEARDYEEGGARIMIRRDVPDEKFYFDVEQKAMTQQRDFMGRKFLIETKADAAKWKLTGNQLTVLNYPCQEAVMQDGDKRVKAWFTPSIPVGTGPHKFAGLPGLVLKVDVNDGQHILEATKVELGAVDKAQIKKPKEGKKMTEVAFREMVEEKMKEMRAEGGDGNVIIRVRR